jgi:hypothetical protein
MFEAFECFVCRRVMALIGADPTRCPGCAAVHGKLIRRAHVAPAAGARLRKRRSQAAARPK